MEKINLSLASSTWGEEEKAILMDVIESDKYTMGQRVQTAEEDFSQYFGSRYAVMVNSGSSANLLMVAALFYTSNDELRLRPGDEVIVPAISWSTTYSPLCQYGLKLKFVDIDRDTLNFDLDCLKDAVSDKTKLIFAVNLLGNPNSYSDIQRIVAPYNVAIIEDNCESMGAKIDNKFTGTIGIMGSFSTFFSHHICTMEGGFITTDNEELYHILISLRAHGWTRDLPTRNHVSGVKSANPFDESFNFVLPGYNLRPIEMSGALASQQLLKLPRFVEMRRQNAQQFTSLFSKIEWLRLQAEIGISSWFGFSLILLENAPLTRKNLLELFSDWNVDTRPIVAGNFLKNPVSKYFNLDVSGSIENAEYADKNGFFIGNHHIDLSDKLDEIHQRLMRL